MNGARGFSQVAGLGRAPLWGSDAEIRKRYRCPEETQGAIQPSNYRHPTLSPVAAMNEKQPDQPFGELNRAVSEGKFAGPAQPRKRRLLPVESDATSPDPAEVFLDAAASAFAERLAEYLAQLEAAGLDVYAVLGPPGEFGERAARRAFPPA